MTPNLPVTNTPNDKGDKAENVPTVAGHLWVALEIQLPKVYVLDRNLYGIWLKAQTPL